MKIFVCAFFLSVMGFLASYSTIDEKIIVALTRDADRSFFYGDRYFGTEASMYNIETAQYFYEQALEYEVDRPYARHQLARIAFLKGDFVEAQRLIDEELAMNPTPSPSSYYIRALIEAYAGNYEASVVDYEIYLSYNPTNWAAINDYAWVLLQQGRARDAVVITAKGLAAHPTNVWLLNTNATALHEIELTRAALDQSKKAVLIAQQLKEEDWLLAYPGNDPAIAAAGIQAFQDSVIHNMHTLSVAMQMSTYNED